MLAKILKLNKTPQPVIYLRGVKYRDLQNLLDFMYQGQVDISEENLPSFLQVAEDLNVRGLYKRNTDVCESNEEYTTQFTNPNIASFSKTKRIDSDWIDNIINDKSFGDIFFHNYMDTKISAPTEIKMEISKDACIKNKKQNIISPAIVEAGGSHMCEQCDYKTFKLQNLKRHIKSVHEGECPYPCNQCDYKAKEKSKLSRHMRSVHEGERPNHCTQCDYKAYEKSNLIKHVMLVHESEQSMSYKM